MKKSLLGISLLTISCLYFLLAAVIILLTIIMKIPVIYGISGSIILLILQFLISPFLTDISMKWFYKATFDYTIPKYLEDFINEVCQKNNMKYPKIGYINDGAPNAFTYGHTKNDARIIVTKGIFDLLTEEEVKAVVAHELGHATHYDMLFMTVAQLVPLIFYFIYENAMDTDSKSSKNDDNSSGALIAVIAYILYVVSNYIVLALSRTREYYADYFSTEVTNNPQALASALVKIGFGLSTASTNGKHSASKSNALGIFDSKTSKALVVTSMDNGQISKDHIKQAMKWEQWNLWARWYEINSTHPLISKRLLAISERCKEMNQEPYIVFDLKKEESYVDDFLLEVFISFLPLISFLIGMIVIGFLFYQEKKIVLAIGITLLVTILFSFIKFRRCYSSKPFEERKVRDLLGEVKVSHITSIPCTMKGKIIGRGNPGCIFNEDFILQDDSGIIFLDYNQPVRIVNTIFAIFKSKEYFDKEITVKGWYRRSPVPYVELKTMEIDGVEKKVYTYTFKKVLLIIGLVIAIGLIIASFI